MKHLQTYKLFESKNFKDIYLVSKYEELTEIISNLKDMSLELQDNECEVVIGPSELQQIKDLRKRNLPIDPRILKFLIILPKSLSSRYETLPDWLIETLNQISDYMESEGFRTSYWLSLDQPDSTSIHRNFNSLEDVEKMYGVYQVRLKFLF
jgi:hypothetical protein